MQIVMATGGSRGEAEPLIALASHLLRSGHKVILVTLEDYHAQARAFGVDVHPVSGSLKASLESVDARRVWAGNRDAVEKWNETFFLPAYRRMLDGIWDAAQHADVLILNSGIIPAQRAGAILNIPTFITCCFPALSPTRYFPHLMGPRLAPGIMFNRLTYLINRLYSAGEHRVVSDWHRTTLKTKPPSRYQDYLKQKGRRLPVLYCYSDIMFPSPPDWDDSICVSGYWTLPPEPAWKPPQALLDYLRSGPPPVCITFSSMVGPDPEGMTDLVARAIQRIPHRVLVCGGWSSLRNQSLPENAFFIDNVPFQWLFPYVSLVVHHGGAGTVGTCAKAGKPSVVCPVGADHPFWAAVSERQGICPPSRPHHELTTEWLADSITTALSTSSMARSADELGRKLREEDSFGKAIEFIERTSESRRWKQARRQKTPPLG
jgi:sterol 3beta-glucosyltransferase